MSNLLEQKKDVNGIYNLMTLVGEKDLYAEFDSDFEEIIKTGKLYQIQEENELLFGDIVNLVKLIHEKHSNTITATRLKNAIQSFLGNIIPFLNALEKSCDKKFFSELTHTFYEMRLSYRFIYELRNISQHKTFVISIQNSINDKMKINLSKNKLIDDFNISKKKIKDIFDELPDNIDLLPYLNEFYMSQCEMIEWVFIHTFNLKSYKRFVDFISPYKHSDNSLLIQRDFRSGKDKNGKDELHMTLISLEIPKYIQRIQSYYNSKLRLVKLGHKFDYINQFYFLN